MKNIPNILSICRIILALSLFFLPALTPEWLIIYFICGFSDMLDGYIARRYNLTSDVGALLDSIADFLMFLIVFLKLAATFMLSKELLILISIIGTIKIASVLVGLKKFQSLPWLHTYANKFAGFCTFLLAPFYFMFPQFQIYFLCFLGTITILASLEELLIIIQTQKLDPNVTSIFYKK